MSGYACCGTLLSVGLTVARNPTVDNFGGSRKGLPKPVIAWNPCSC